MGKSRQQQTRNVLDPQTQAYLDSYRQRASGAADSALPAGVNANTFAGNLGFGSQTGAGGIEAYTDPYESQVVQGINTDFDRQQQMASKAAADEATKAGSFGGSRGAVLSAQLQGDVNRNRTATLANVRQQGYDSAYNRLLNERNRQANLGFGGLNYLDQRRQQGLAGLLPGLMPGSGSGSNTQMPYNDFADILGLGIQGVGLAAPGGFFGRTVPR